ncbi:MAG: hypothetical protein IJC52_03285 [Clostridia bacterium]|nr:hypothetical protein [Clostridia bacterium]
MFKPIMIAATLLSGVLTAGLYALYVFSPAPWMLSLIITAGTFFYHFAMRLAVGYAWVPFQKHDPHSVWFREKAFEKKLYKQLNVKHWKEYMPTYDPSSFDVNAHSLDEIAVAMCHSELVHETIVVLSFLPLLAAIPFGDFFVFFITSLLAAAFDLSFVIMQRYNRPRVLTLIKRQNKKHNR